MSVGVDRNQNVFQSMTPGVATTASVSGTAVFFAEPRPATAVRIVSSSTVNYSIGETSITATTNHSRLPGSVIEYRAVNCFNSAVVSVIGSASASTVNVEFIY